MNDRGERARYDQVPTEELEQLLEQSLDDAERERILAALTQRYKSQYDELLPADNRDEAPQESKTYKKQSATPEDIDHGVQTEPPVPSGHRAADQAKLTSSEQKSGRMRTWIVLLATAGTLAVCAFVAFLVIVGGTADADSRTETTSRPVPTQRPTSNVSFTPRATAANTGGTFSGITGRAQLSWTTDGVRYLGVIDTNGRSGTVDVSYRSPQTGALLVIRQDLTLTSKDGNWFYVGSNPRYAGTVTRATSYAPDIFRLSELDIGGWTVDATCDSLFRCAFVSLTPLD